MERLISFFGLLVMVALAWPLSSHRRIVPWRTIAIGIALQFVFAFLTLHTRIGRAFFAWLGQLITALLGFVDEGAAFVFGTTIDDGSRGTQLLTSFAFGVLPSIIFFSSLMALLYHFNVMQRIVRVAAIVMQKAFRLSGAESLSVAANIFVGQVEGPLVVRPYLGTMTQSELMAIMVAGFATVAGGVLAAYVKMGIDATHMMTASVISAPASIVIAKMLQPEVGQPVTLGRTLIEDRPTTVNAIDAVATGALDGLKLSLQVAAILIAFLALIAMLKFALAWILGLFGSAMTLEDLLGLVFAPFAWLMSIPAEECRKAGELLGIRMITNEFIAYAQLAELIKDPASMSPRSEVILTYALCGFANFGSIGVQIGGIGALAPNRAGDLARLGLRAMLGGTLATFMTACVAGVLI